jgi:hypothetical protein
MNEPVLAKPLDESEKKAIFENMLKDVDEKKLLVQYIDTFLTKNQLKGYETSEISKRKLLASLVLAALVFLEIVFFALYHLPYVLVAMVFEVLFYLIFFHKQNLKRYLIREVLKRPDDNLDNILISQVSGAKKGLRNLLFAVSPLLAVVAVSCLLFMRPHMIFEKESGGGYALRYYTIALFPEDTVVIPETYKGQPVDAIRGNVFKDVYTIRYVTLPSRITEIRGSTFERCSSLEEIDIPNGVTRIGGHAFCDCKSLKKVRIPITVTSIGSSAFRRCYSLGEVKIPAGIDINDRAFKETPAKLIFY